MKFKKEILQELVDDDADVIDGFHKVHDEIIETTRWSVLHKMVFQAPCGKHYRSTYSVGATEDQDESPYEYADDEIKCQEVVEVEVVRKEWKAVK